MQGPQPLRRYASKEIPMSPRKDVVQAYIEGFRRSDHELILSCLTDDIVWVLPGYALITGKETFDKEIENETTMGSPKLTIDRLIEEDDTVVATGTGEVSLRTGETLSFVFTDVFTFTGDK